MQASEKNMEIPKHRLILMAVKVPYEETFLQVPVLFYSLPIHLLLPFEKIIIAVGVFVVRVSHAAFLKEVSFLSIACRWCFDSLIG